MTDTAKASCHSLRSPSVVQHAHLSSVRVSQLVSQSAVSQPVSQSVSRSKSVSHSWTVQAHVSHAYSAFIPLFLHWSVSPSVRVRPSAVNKNKYDGVVKGVLNASLKKKFMNVALGWWALRIYVKMGIEKTEGLCRYRRWGEKLSGNQKT